jgi:Cdc6-like AAA superfamily ATPase
MNEDQQLAVATAEDGHSLLITGSCGTGKTHTLESLIKRLEMQGKRVVVCASTGIYCLL